MKRTADDLPVHSVIVFSERCTLKNVTVKSDEIRVITRDALKSTAAQIMEASHAVLENERIQALYEQLYPFSQVDKEVKKRHIDAADTPRAWKRKTV